MPLCILHETDIIVIDIRFRVSDRIGSYTGDELRGSVLEITVIAILRRASNAAVRESGEGRTKSGRQTRSM